MYYRVTVKVFTIHKRLFQCSGSFFFFIVLFLFGSIPHDIQWSYLLLYSGMLPIGTWRSIGGIIWDAWDQILDSHMQAKCLSISPCTPVLFFNLSIAFSNLLRFLSSTYSASLTESYFSLDQIMSCITNCNLNYLSLRQGHGIEIHYQVNLVPMQNILKGREESYGKNTYTISLHPHK